MALNLFDADCLRHSDCSLIGDRLLITFIVQLLQLPDGVTFNGTAAIQCKHERNLATRLGAGRDRRNASVGAG